MYDKIYCWHASFYSSFNHETFGGAFGQTSFHENIYRKLKNIRGIQGYTLLIVDFFRGNARMYFSINKNLGNSN